MTALSLLLALWVPEARAQTVPPSDVSISTVGAQGVTSVSAGPDQGAAGADMDLVLGQRLRWTLAGGEEAPSTTRALVDARFTVDPGPGPAENPAFEWSQVRQLGAEITTDNLTLDVGRHPVFRGGPRLVDGVQVLLRPSETVDVGAWAGLAPSIFTTLPQLRPGGGPIVALTRSRLQASLVGEVLMWQGQLDRAGFLAMGRASTNQLLEVAGRLDVELASAEGGPRLADFQIATLLSPTSALRIDALYNAFSSYRYVSSADLDPDLQRFAQRLQTLDDLLGIQQDVRDPTLNHLVGGSVRLQPDNDGVAPMVELLGRYRAHPDPENTYLRISPTAGVVRIADRLDVLLNANLLQVTEQPQYDAGLIVVLDATDTLAFDASVRRLFFPIDTVEPRPDLPNAQGWYVDFYVDVVDPKTDLLFMAGVSVMSEPDIEQPDGEYGLFVRASKYLRPAR